MLPPPSSYRPVTIFDGVFAAAARQPRKIALIEGARALPFGDLAARAQRVAAGAHALAGGARHHTAVMLPNCLEYMEIVGGLATAGCAPVLLSHQATAAELAAICNNAEARILFAHADQEELVRAAQLETVHTVVFVGKDYDDWLARARAGRTDYGVQEWETFALHYTSGTTGLPKGGLVPHRARVLLMYAMAVEYGCFGPDDRGLTACPLHTGGGFAFGLAPIFFGGTLVIQPRFDAEETLRLVARERITNINVVPTHVERLVRLGAGTVRRYDLSSLRALMSGGAAFPMPTKERAVELFGPTVLHEMYGSVEGGIQTNLRPADQLRKPNSVGLPFPMNEVRLLDVAGNDVRPGETGEFFWRSPTLFNGYWKNPEATRDLMRGDWLSVGDLARVDEEGYIHIVGRKKEMIVSGGSNIYPAEIEQVMNAHPLVAESAVIGVPDPEWGESVCAFVALKPGATMTADDMARFCRQSLSRYKVPKSFRFLDKLPRDSAMGKIQRKVLRDLPPQ